ncbi:MAG: thioredoxin family protein [Alphaproteobacteria bacterium]
MMTLKSLVFLVITAVSVLPSQAALLQTYNVAALEEAQKSNRIIVLHFFKNGCHPCNLQKKVLSELKAPEGCPQCKDVVFFQVDVDEKDNLALMEKNGVATATVIVVLQGEKSLGRTAGTTGATELLDFINNTTKLQFQA